MCKKPLPKNYKSTLKYRSSLFGSMFSWVPPISNCFFLFICNTYTIWWYSSVNRCCFVELFNAQHLQSLVARQSTIQLLNNVIFGGLFSQKSARLCAIRYKIWIKTCLLSYKVVTLMLSMSMVKRITNFFHIYAIFSAQFTRFEILVNLGCQFLYFIYYYYCIL